MKKVNDFLRNHVRHWLFPENNDRSTCNCDANYWVTEIKVCSLRKPQCDCWLRLMDGTIGNSDSKATLLASEKAKNLYCALWNNIDPMNAPVMPKRGKTALDDFNEGKPLQLYQSDFVVLANYQDDEAQKGIFLGGTAGYPALRPLTIAQMPKHSHSISDPGHAHRTLNIQAGAQGRVVSTPSITGDSHTNNVEFSKTGIKVNTRGSSADVDFRQPTLYQNFYIKL